MGGNKFALGILLMFGALVGFFFAFHPNGVAGVKNPGEMLQFLMTQFQTASTDPSKTAGP